MKTNLYIPKTITVGFQNRPDTFTGKLAYVIYKDEKNKLRKESSWQGWRDNKIAPVEYENVPTKFVFNKNVDRHGYFGSGRSVMRVYDERDFEFEISMENLVGILMHSDVSKRDIVEPCVFAWAGPDLVLLPVNSEEYQASLAYTKKQAENVSAKSLVKGHSYSQKKNEDVLTYIGYFNWYVEDTEYMNDSCQTRRRFFKNSGKKHIFYNERTKEFKPVSMTTLSSECSNEVADNYARLVDDFYKIQEAWPMTTYGFWDKRDKYNRRMYKEENGLILGVYGADYASDLAHITVSSCVKPVHVNGNIEFHYDTSYDNPRGYYGYSGQNQNPLQAAFQKKLRDAVVAKGWDVTKRLSSNQISELLKDDGFKSMYVANERGKQWSVHM